MKVVGLTGGIAMGKSEVAKIFAAHGMPVFDSDAAVHDLYASAEGVALMRPLAPEAVRDGKVDRPRLSAAILADDTLLPKIEAAVHAAIAERRRRFLAEARSAGHRLAVVDVPLLFEKGYDRDVDVTVTVSAPPDQQRARALARPGMTEAKLEMILKRQMPDSEKRRRATFIIDNIGTLEDLRRKTEAVITALKETGQ